MAFTWLSQSRRPVPSIVPPPQSTIKICASSRAVDGAVAVAGGRGAREGGGCAGAAPFIKWDEGSLCPMYL
eukprot:scaffold1991_cov111-Isochrysis_galbana.AAC.1